MGDYDPINCPICGRFLRWEEASEQYVCVCNRVGTYVDKKAGRVTIYKRHEPRIHEVRSLHRKVNESE